MRDERIRFLGPVDDIRKWGLLRSARMLVLPSLSENFGNVVLEAMAVGLPVVLTPEVFPRWTGTDSRPHLPAHRDSCLEPARR